MNKPTYDVVLDRDSLCTSYISFFNEILSLSSLLKKKKKFPVDLAPW